MEDVPTYFHLDKDLAIWMKLIKANGTLFSFESLIVLQFLKTMLNIAVNGMLFVAYQEFGAQ